jgi:hypothetical protein
MKKKRKSLIEAELAMDRLLRRVGYTGKYKGSAVNDIPNYKMESNLPKTSDAIPGKTPKKTSQVYTGTEIAGIVTTHKSNLMPIRKDNKQAAIDAAQMRRN